MTQPVSRWPQFARDQCWRTLLKQFSLVLLVCFVARSAAAQAEPSGSRRSQARQLAMEGADAFVAKDYSRALERFQRASKLYDAPTITLMEARALAELGDLLEASKQFRVAEQTALKPSATRAFREAVKDAAVEGAQVRARLPHINVRCEAPPFGVVIYLDGQPLQLERHSARSAINPGQHVVRATAPGHVEFEKTLSIGERQDETVDVELTVRELARPSAETQAAKPRPVVAQESAPALGIVGLVTGGVAATFAGVFFTVAWREKESLDTRCSPTCPAGSQGDIDRFRLHRSIAFTSLGAGVAAAGVGGYLVWGRRRESSHVAVSLGADHVTLTGAF